MARSFLLILLLSASSLGALPEASAHHFMNNATPATFSEGLLSGLGHPLIGIDHLAILLAVGIGVGAAQLSLLTPALFVAASAIGVALHVLGAEVPASQLLVAGSVLVAGLLIAIAAPLRPATWCAVFALAGVLHGYAFGESVAGAEQTPIWAYLLGLAVVQGLITTAVAALMRTPWVSQEFARLAGGVICGVGLVVLTGQLLP
jgi:urease accessory protein